MKLRAQLVIDMDANGYAEAAEHQSRMESLLSKLKQEYGQVEMSFHERRVRSARPQPSPQVRRHTGRLNQYEEA